MKTKLTVYHIATCLIVMALAASCTKPQDEGVYILNPQENLYPSSPAQSKDSSVPLKISYYNDVSASMSFEELRAEDFIPSKENFNPGFYKGVLYIDVAFKSLSGSQDYSYVLWLGYDPLDFAEAFVPCPDGSFNFIGRTGRGILKEQMSFKSWRLSIGFDTEQIKPSLDQDGYEHIIIRTQSYMGAGIHIKIIPARVFLTATNETLMIQFLLFGMYILSIAFAFCYGIIKRNNIFTVLGVSAFSLLLLMLQQKGFGPLYLWNSFSSLPNSPRFIFYMSITTFTLILIDFILFAGAHSSINIPDKAIPFAIITMVVFISFSTVVHSPLTVFIVFSVIAFCQTGLALLLLTVLFLKHRRTMQKEIKIATLSWALDTALIFISLIARTLEAFNLVTPDGSFYPIRFFMLDINFILLMFPAVYVSLKRFSSESKQRSSQNQFLSKERDLYAQATDELLSINNSILNTARLPLSFEAIEIKREKTLVEAAATHATDILNAISVIKNDRTLNESPIQFVSFFKSCVHVIDSYFQRAEKIYDFSTNIADSMIVFADEDILQFLFKSFLLTTLRYSARTQKAKIQLLNNEGINFVTIKVTPPAVSDETENALPEFYLEKEIVKLYGGTISIQKTNTNILFSLSLNLNNQITKTKKPQIIKTEVKEEYFLDDADGKKNRHSSNGKKNSVLFVEGTAETARLLKPFLEKECDVTLFTNGADAWNYLTTQKNLPDIILMEYKLPLLSGMALLAKCQRDPLIKNIPVMMMLPAQNADERPRVLKSGAISCFVYPFKAEELASRLYAILNITTMARSSVMSRIQDVESTEKTSDENEYGLSEREKEIAALIALGKSDKEIADTLNISPATVATHNKKIFKKLNVHSRVELMTKIR